MNSKSNCKSFAKPGFVPGDKVGFLIDLFNGSIRIYINEVDKGLAVTNESTLKEGVYYLTLDKSDKNGFKGTVNIVSSSPSTSQISANQLLTMSDSEAFGGTYCSPLLNLF